MASRLDHPTMSTETQRARALELARAAERRRATQAHGDRTGRRSSRAVAAGLSSLIARLGRGTPEDPEPCLCGRVPS